MTAQGVSGKVRIVRTTVESIDHMAPFDHANVECSNVCEQVFETVSGVIDELDNVFAVDDRKSQLGRRCGPKVFAPLYHSTSKDTKAAFLSQSGTPGRDTVVLVK
jgi:hypothetical protein